MKVKVLTPLQHNGQLHEAGSVVDLDDKTAQQLVSQNVVTTGNPQTDGAATAQQAAPEVAQVSPEQAQPAVAPEAAPESNTPEVAETPAEEQDETTLDDEEAEDVAA